MPVYTRTAIIDSVASVCVTEGVHHVRLGLPFSDIHVDYAKHTRKCVDHGGRWLWVKSAIGRHDQVVQVPLEKAVRERGQTDVVLTKAKG